MDNVNRERIVIANNLKETQKRENKTPSMLERSLLIKVGQFG